MKDILTENQVYRAVKKALKETPLKVLVAPRKEFFYLKKLTIGQGGKETPPQGKYWEIIAASFSHATGTKSQFWLKINKDATYTNPPFYATEAAASASGWYTIDLSKAKQLIVTDRDEIGGGGGAGMSIFVLVKEYDA